MEQRGLAVVTTCGTLATLLAGFVAVAARNAHVLALPIAITISVGGALFAVASILGLWVNLPRNYGEPSDAWLQDLTAEDTWSLDATIGARRVAETNARTLAKHRSVNQGKADLLVAAMGAEVAAVTVLAVAVGLAIFHT